MEEISNDGSVITIDGAEYNSSNLTDLAKSHLYNLSFVNQEILQRNNELQIADSARIMYLSVLKTELSSTGV